MNTRAAMTETDWMADDGRSATDSTQWRRLGALIAAVMTQGGRSELIVAAARQLVAYDTDSGKQNWVVSRIPSQTCASPILGEGSVIVSATGPYGEPENYVELPAYKKFLAETDKNDDGVLQLSEIPTNRVVVDRRTSTGAGNSSSGYFFRGMDVNQDKVISEQEWENQTEQLTAASTKIGTPAFWA